MILGVVEPLERLTGSCLPEQQLPIMVAGWHVDNNLEQSAEVRHTVNLRPVARPAPDTPTCPRSSARGGKSREGSRGYAKEPCCMARPVGGMRVGLGEGHERTIFARRLPL